ncbi:hypothetical protein FZC84_22590 [Rossellomorea vietnamensis]|uniref:Uncharacterized protein n=1 Tax=Rossellomorea vietnamensis TaxID=218284 RepID=A0A5D4LY36_9BACI|nr:hypothetical protein [Rossellomorea vietnamensis]TYR94291.1 hypothetical protein FZC84_22590 [Rossellomorea vietnamensis]
MKNREEQQEIRNSLDRDVFSKYQFKSQHGAIMKKATEVSKTPRKEKYYYFGLSGVAVILFSIVALSYILTSNPDHAPSSTADQEEAESEQPDVNHHEYIADPDFPLPPHEPDNSFSENEKAEPDNIEKTEEEWKAYFQTLYNEQRENIKKLHLIYESSSPLSNTAEIEILSKFEEESFIVRENQISFENGKVTLDHSYISTNKEYIFLDHQRNTYNHESTSVTAEDWIRDRSLYTGSPIYHLHEMAFNGYSWTVIEQNLKENWILFELNKIDPQVFLFQRGRIKVQYDSGVILEEKEFDGENFVSTFKLKKLRKNDDLTELPIDKSIPENYIDMQEYRSQQKQVIISQSVFDLAEDRVMLNNNKIREVMFTGEDGHLHFVLKMDAGTSSTEGKEAGQELVEEFTEAANASESFQKKKTTIWAEGQYDFTIRVEVPATAFLYGTPEDSEIFWESKAYGEY